MTTSHPPESFLPPPKPTSSMSRAVRVVAWCSIVTVFLAQTIFAIAYCMTEPLWSFFAASLLVAPAVAMAFTKNPYRSIGACLGIMPFLVWAGQVTCMAPDLSRGPSFAYASVFMFGIPVAVAVGLFFGRLNGGSGSKVIFTLFRIPGMSDKQFAEDAGLVERDLKTLKSILER